MTILLFLLKIIGIILLVILGILVVSLLYVVFLPWHYSIEGAHHQTDGWSGFIAASGFLNFWQFHLKEEQQEYQLFVYAFWGRLQLHPKKKKKSKPQRDQKTAEETVLDEQDIADILSEKTVARQPNPTVRQTRDTKQQTKKQPQGTDRQKTTEKHQSKHRQKQKKKHRNAGFSGERWEDFHNQCKDEHNKKAVLFLAKKILWFIKKVRPRILEADVTFSLGDPAWTGGATGLLSLCPGCYGKHTSIIPDFESDEMYVRGWIRIKGIVFFWHIVYLIISIYFNKDCKKLFHLS